MELFAANLRKRAEELGIPNAEVARRAGLTERRYGNYVSGRREPDLATLVRIATALGTTPSDLLLEQPKTKTSKEMVRERAAAALAALESEDLKRLTIMLEALASARNQ